MKDAPARPLPSLWREHVFIYLKGRIIERKERETWEGGRGRKRREREPSSAGLLPKCLQWLRLHQTEAKSL